MVEGMAERYGVSLRHAQKVARLANDLFHDLQSVHQLAPPLGRLLEASAYLHDVGHYVSDTRHHKHSYYLVANSDMPGFNLTERGIIANLCRYHRKSMPAPEHDSFQDAECGRPARCHCADSAVTSGRQSGSRQRAEGAVSGVRCA